MNGLKVVGYQADSLEATEGCCLGWDAPNSYQRTIDLMETDVISLLT